ncbi:MAG: radical SAM family heme chaperone HemW [Alphaproteobacteria bacterium]|nr:radical SAM family heme chaperone HemW [Alphaproteobacteria bacterium]
MLLLPHNLYFHIPFCAQKCNYCAFYSHACKKPDWDKYLNEILGEIEFWHKKIGQIEIPTIFFGGGTPSLMPENILEKIISAIGEKFSITPDCEISLESNPGTIDENKLSDFKSMGINRLSVGIQSLDDETLKFLGRIHNANQAIDLLNNAKKLGFNVSADFMYGLPNQSVTDVKNFCKKINELGLNHCSMYELSIEPNTPFYRMNLQMPDNETMAQMYESIDKTLDLPRYEVSNYATPGFECKHNQNIWDGEPYIGFGRGAAGRPFINGTWYEQIGNNEKFEPISARERDVEKIITGMRTTRGVKITDDIDKILNAEFIKSNPDLLVIENDRIKTTKKGLLILDEILLDLIEL